MYIHSSITWSVRCHAREAVRLDSGELFAKCKCWQPVKRGNRIWGKILSKLHQQLSNLGTFFHKVHLINHDSMVRSTDVCFLPLLSPYARNRQPIISDNTALLSFNRACVHFFGTDGLVPGDAIERYVLTVATDLHRRNRSVIAAQQEECEQDTSPRNTNLQ